MERNVNQSNTHFSNINIPVSLGELVDKITILQIKKEIMTGEKLKNVRKELESLLSIIKKNDIDVAKNFFTRLKDINLILWNIEDQIRLKENHKEFDNDFIELARSVYIQNDKRAFIKREINEKYNSALIEEKSYENY